MNDPVRDAIIAIVGREGRDVVTAPRRFQSLLLDYCPNNRREINLLMIAIVADVPAQLRTSETQPALLLPRLVQRLRAEYGMDEVAAAWTVETLAQVYGKSSRRMDSDTMPLPSPEPEPLPDPIPDRIIGPLPPPILTPPPAPDRDRIPARIPGRFGRRRILLGAGSMLVALVLIAGIIVFAVLSGNATYTSTQEGFSLRYPKHWSPFVNPYFGPDKRLHSVGGRTFTPSLNVLIQNQTAPLVDRADAFRNAHVSAPDPEVCDLWSDVRVAGEAAKTMRCTGKLSETGEVYIHRYWLVMHNGKEYELAAIESMHANPLAAFLAAIPDKTTQTDPIRAIVDSFTFLS